MDANTTPVDAKEPVRSTFGGGGGPGCSLPEDPEKKQVMYAWGKSLCVCRHLNFFVEMLRYQDLPYRSRYLNLHSTCNKRFAKAVIKIHDMGM